MKLQSKRGHYLLLSNHKSPPILKDTSKVFAIKLANACACSVTIMIPEFEHKELVCIISSDSYLHTYIFFSFPWPGA